MNKHVNEHFFDKESKIMMYIFGISLAIYSPERNGPRNTWTSSNEGLLTIVRDHLKSNVEIGRPSELNSRNLQFRNQYLHDKLIERGCVYDKSERKFPEGIKKWYSDHLMRGFFDAHVTCSYVMGKYPLLQIYSNPVFLQGLHNQLVADAGVSDSKKIDKSPLVYGREDVEKIHDFIYSDWSFIKRHNLYLPSKKERLEINK
ncbi:hypothetical protein J4480_02045 [Candidatus Woesearchaeota archaeon]|nr:hypothetical protein [Candidatus Woesearchaeota archaeon]